MYKREPTNLHPLLKFYWVLIACPAKGQASFMLVNHIYCMSLDIRCLHSIVFLILCNHFFKKQKKKVWFLFFPSTQISENVSYCCNQNCSFCLRISPYIWLMIMLVFKKKVRKQEKRIWTTFQHNVLFVCCVRCCISSSIRKPMCWFRICMYTMAPNQRSTNPFPTTIGLWRHGCCPLPLHSDTRSHTLSFLNLTYAGNPFLRLPRAAGYLMDSTPPWTSLGLCQCWVVSTFGSAAVG